MTVKSSGLDGAVPPPVAIRPWAASMSEPTELSSGPLRIASMISSGKRLSNSPSLASSSGISAIDSAALATARGSLPAAPEGVVVPSLSVTVPLRFSPGR